ncbi:MAG: phosphatase PAP2-related protein [Candidatus Woesearchaeota archaeon]
MHKRLISWRQELQAHKKQILISLGFLILAAYVLHFTSSYADQAGDGSAKDLILDHIPVVDLTPLLVYGYMFVVFTLFLYPLFFRVRKLHTVIILASLVLIVRGFFVSLTHLSMPAGAIISRVPELYNLFYYRNDLFFSGHTALPFLGYLIFRKEKMGKFFLVSTIVMASTVLLMHVHYSIDVFAALFITYGVYRGGSLLMKRYAWAERTSAKTKA